MKSIVSILIIIFLVACKKDGGDREKPVINITSPTAGQQFPGGQVVNVKGTITDNDELHEVHIKVVNKNNSTEVEEIHEHPDMKSYNINFSFVAAAGITYQIKAEADDHSGNATEVEIEVKGN